MTPNWMMGNSLGDDDFDRMMKGQMPRLDEEAVLKEIARLAALEAADDLEESTGNDGMVWNT